MTLSHRFHRLLRLPAFWIGTLLTIAGLASNLATGQANGEKTEASRPVLENQVRLLREGSRIDNQHALCRDAGDRLVVELTEDNRVLPALENLAAQRILKSVQDDSGDERWIVNGLVTEFQEANYILLDRVVREPKN